MADFTVTITDQAQLDGITWAREKYNAALPKDEQGEPIGNLDTDQDYVQFVMDAASKSYAREMQAGTMSSILRPAGGML